MHLFEFLLDFGGHRLRLHCSVSHGPCSAHHGAERRGVAYTKAWVLNWNKVAEAKWFALPELMPVKPVFDMRAIAPVMIMFIVTAVETVGDISGVIMGGMDREATDTELSGGVICDGIGSSFAALFGVLPNTSFSQNVGLVSMTKVVNRFALATGGIFLILCGLVPKLGALVSIMPQSVLGGAAVMMFSSIVVSGIQLITREPLDPAQPEHRLCSARSWLRHRCQQRHPCTRTADALSGIRRLRHCARRTRCHPLESGHSQGRKRLK